MEHGKVPQRWPIVLGDAYLLALAVLFFVAGLAGIWAGVDMIKRPGMTPVVSEQLARLK